MDKRKRKFTLTVLTLTSILAICLIGTIILSPENIVLIILFSFLFLVFAAIEVILGFKILIEYIKKENSKHV